MFEPDLPPRWYSRTARVAMKYRGVIWLLIYFLIFFVWPFFRPGEQLDIELLVGIPTD